MYLFNCYIYHVSVQLLLLPCICSIATSTIYLFNCYIYHCYHAFVQLLHLPCTCSTATPTMHLFNCNFYYVVAQLFLLQCICSMVSSTMYLFEGINCLFVLSLVTGPYLQDASLRWLFVRAMPIMSWRHVWPYWEFCTDFIRCVLPSSLVLYRSMKMILICFTLVIHYNVGELQITICKTFVHWKFQNNTHLV